MRWGEGGGGWGKTIFPLPQLAGPQSSAYSDPYNPSNPPHPQMTSFKYTVGASRKCIVRIIIRYKKVFGGRGGGGGELGAKEIFFFCPSWSSVHPACSPCNPPTPNDKI